MKQSRKEIMAALRNLISDNLDVTVFDDTKSGLDIKASEYPAVMVRELDDTTSHNVTSTKDYLLNVGIRLYARDIDQIMDLDDAMLDLLAENPTLSGTALVILGVRSDFPWNLQSNKGDNTIVRDRTFQIRYRRDFKATS